MKRLFTILSVCFCNFSYAQSPGLIIKLGMDSLKADNLHFKIEMKFCEPVKKSTMNGYFTNDRSTINFKKLTPKDIACGKYIDNDEETHPFYNYRFSNQVFAWEKIIVWRISASTQDLREPMYVILPVKIKSFVTFIEVKDVEFSAGKFIWLDEEGKIGADKYQHLSVSLKNRKGLDTKKCPLKKLLN